MQNKNIVIFLVAVFAVLCSFLATAPSAFSKETVLYRFAIDGEYGATPLGGVILDAAGNLYGTTSSFGPGGCRIYICGTIFKLAPSVDKWKLTTLHKFHNDSKDGLFPASTVIFDAAGNLYGTTMNGGIFSCKSGCGTVYRLTPSVSGKWTETSIHKFRKGGQEGIFPSGSLIFDAAGNLYGTTSEGGTGRCKNRYDHVIGCGTVFELSPSNGGKWMEKVLYSFQSDASDGNYPQASLTFDEAGNLYGTTELGGVNNGGTVFQLTPGAGGAWTETVLYSFCSISGCMDGGGLYSNVIFDAAGNLYGTTLTGGATGYGTVFELSPSMDGEWTESVLHSFCRNCNGDGYFPLLGLAFDSAGNMYGTTLWGGSCDCGVIYKMVPRGNGQWSEKVVHNFYFNHRKDSGEIAPHAVLVFDKGGNLYGTTSGGGADAGTVFKFTP